MLIVRDIVMWEERTLRNRYRRRHHRAAAFVLGKTDRVLVIYFWDIGYHAR